MILLPFFYALFLASVEQPKPLVAYSDSLSTVPCVCSVVWLTSSALFSLDIHFDTAVRGSIAKSYLRFQGYPLAFGSLQRR